MRIFRDHRAGGVSDVIRDPLAVDGRQQVVRKGGKRELAGILVTGPAW